VRMSNAQLRHIIKEEIQESLGTSYNRMRSSQEIANALKQLETVMIRLLHQKQSTDPGTVEHDAAKEQLARLAALANEYAYRSERR
jgi:hypothetical protein